MFSMFTYIMSRVTHSEPGLPMVPLRHLHPSVIYSVPCDRILQKGLFCWRTPSYLLPREWWNYCTSPRSKRTIYGEATNKTQGFHVSGLFSSVWDQNGELFVACSLDLRTFSLLFRSLSDVKALEIYFQYQWNPLAYNYITTVKKEPLLSRLVVLIL